MVFKVLFNSIDFEIFFKSSHDYQQKIKNKIIIFSSKV